MASTHISQLPGYKIAHDAAHLVLDVELEAALYFILTAAENMEVRQE